MQTYTLFDLHRYLRQVLALNFPEPVWIEAEVAQIQQVRGHWFAELVHKDDEGDGGLLAKATAVCWQTAYRQIRRERGRVVDEILRAGWSVRLLVQVDFHEQYGYQLRIEDVDPDFSLGRLERYRRETIDLLRQSGALDQNRQRPLPPVLQRLAVISSATAAGYEDFCEQLRHNPYGYKFAVELFPAAVQGEQAPDDIRRQLRQIERRQADFSAIVILRGGGARLDLLAFDDRELCLGAAKSSLPILTGIGHESDETVLDLVAHTRLKTPTAAAEFIIARSLQFENDLLLTGRRLGLLVESQVALAGRSLDGWAQRLDWLSRAAVREQHDRLERWADDLPRLARMALRRAHTDLDGWENLVRTLDPATVLNRGYALLYDDAGRHIGSAAAIPSGTFRIRLADGEVGVQRTED